MTATCPYIVTSDEGTSYCRLAEVNSQPTPNSNQIRNTDHIGDANKMVNSSARLTGSLVERVAVAISRCEDSSCWDDEAVNWEPEARAAIREVAEWLREERGWIYGAGVLEEETER